jgi:hypothetical protein
MESPSDETIRNLMRFVWAPDISTEEVAQRLWEVGRLFSVIDCAEFLILEEFARAGNRADFEFLLMSMGYDHEDAAVLWDGITADRLTMIGNEFVPRIQWPPDLHPSCRCSVGLVE